MQIFSIDNGIQELESASTCSFFELLKLYEFRTEGLLPDGAEEST